MEKISFKKNKWVLFVACLSFICSCGWVDVPSYSEAEISGVQFYYRWASDSTDPITGEPVVEEQRLNTTILSLVSDSGTISCAVGVPEASGSFTESVRKQVSTNPLWGQVTVSTGARITPVDGTAALGTPDDWSKTRKFSVEAANGDTKVWSITIDSFVNDNNE